MQNVTPVAPQVLTATNAASPLREQLHHEQCAADLFSRTQQCVTAHLAHLAAAVVPAVCHTAAGWLLQVAPGWE